MTIHAVQVSFARHRTKPRTAFTEDIVQKAQLQPHVAPEENGAMKAQHLMLLYARCAVASRTTVLLRVCQNPWMVLVQMGLLRQMGPILTKGGGLVGKGVPRDTSVEVE